MEFDAVNYAALRRVRSVKAIREASGTGASANNTWVTLVSISGKGWLYQLEFEKDPLSAMSVRVTIDGGSPVLINVGLMLISMPNGGAMPIIGVRFDTSVLVEYSQASATSYNATANVVWGER